MLDDPTVNVRYLVDDVEAAIDAVEYVNQFFMDKAKDQAYLAEMAAIEAGPLPGMLRRLLLLALSLAPRLIMPELWQLHLDDAARTGGDGGREV